MEKIAIVGLACLFPGAQTPEEYWQNLLKGKDSTTNADVDQMGVDARIFYHPRKGTLDKYYSIRGGYIRDFAFDPTGYQLSAEFLETLDDLFKWPLFAGKQALEDSGYFGKPSVLKRCGLIMGSLLFPTKSSHHLFAPIYEQTMASATKELIGQPAFSLKQLASSREISRSNFMTSGYPAALVSQALALGGVRFTLDAACASSLYAVKLAREYLLSGKADMMLAGAVSAADPLFINMGFSIFQAYPEDGASCPLDKSSGGLIAGEGAGMFVLKRYSDALRDGDKIYALIKGIGLSNDGKGKFLLQPNSKGQILAFERAYANAGVNPASIDYVECHATGTPIGDKTELDSMDAFFGRHGARPLLGSAKSNFGHMLTAAGMAGMTKAILSMRHDKIPATINLTAPLSSASGVISNEQIVKSTIPWPAGLSSESGSNGKNIQAPATKHTAVSAFGFGGTNAHLIMEDPGKSAPPQEQATFAGKKQMATKDEQSGLAIIGMDAFFGPCDGLDSLGRTIYEGKQHFRAIPAGRWHGIEAQTGLLKSFGFKNGEAPDGAYVTDFDMDFLQFKIPPNNDQPIPQQLLILKVADRALRDSALPEGSNVAVIVAASAELALHRFRSRCDLSWQLEASLLENGIELTAQQQNELKKITKDSIHEPAQVNQYTSFIGNIMASRISSQWDFSGPSFTLSAEENSAFRAIEVARMLLDIREVDAVVVGAVDLSGGVENVLMRNQLAQVNRGQPTLSLDQHSNGWLIGEGAGAVVLKRHDDAIKSQDRVYAVIEALSMTQMSEKQQGVLHTPSTKGVEQACRMALAETNCSPADIGYLELFASGIAAEDEAEVRGLTSVYQAASQDLNCAIGSIKTNVGHTFAASGIASLIKTAHCLYYRYIPATPNWSAPKLAASWHGSSFYVSPKSKPWLLDSATPKRIAAISGLGGDASYTHLVLSEATEQKERASGFLSRTPFYILPVTGHDQPEIARKLKDLEQSITTCDSLATAVQQSLTSFQENSNESYALVLLGHNKDELIGEIRAALDGLAVAFETGSEWKTPLGSYFTPKPLGDQGRVCFVYPGAFSSYPGMGRDLFHLFPALHDSFAGKVADAAQLFGDRSLFPRSLHRLSSQETERRTLDLMSDSITMLQSGATYSTLITEIIRKQFKITPDAALGYSLGETTMMFALGLWSVEDNNSEDLRTSPLFRDRLSGPKRAVREFWGLPNAKVETDDDIWSIFVLKAPVDTVRSVVNHVDRVYITHINTPNEVVIGGEPGACNHTIEELQCDFVPVPYSHVIHCEPTRSEQTELQRLNTLPLARQPEFKLYFAAREDSGLLDAETVGRCISTATCEQLNFPALVERAYADGARLFVELGPRSACTWWIGDILKDKKHLAASVNRRSLDDYTGLLRLFAQLASHRVALDLSPLYETPVATDNNRPSLVRSVSLTEQNIGEAILTDENKRKFQEPPYGTPPLSVENLDENARAGNGGRQAELIRKNHDEHAGQHVRRDEPGAHKADALGGQRINSPKVQQTEEDVRPATHVEVRNTFVERHFRWLSENNSRINKGHAAFLSTRQQAMWRLQGLTQLQESTRSTGNKNASGSLPENYSHEPPVSRGTQTTAPVGRRQQPEALMADRCNARDGGWMHEAPLRPNNYSKPGHVIWDETDLLQFAEGDIAPVFGDQYAIIDTYSRRVRLPMPPYLLVSRITKLSGRRDVFEPSSMTTEYDIPFDGWNTTDGQVGWAVSVESGQCDLLLISYLGIDFANKGQRVYRLLDCTLTFLEEMPMEGHTLRYDISIDSFAKNGESLLFFFSYNCYVGDKMVLKMRGGCAGFFSDEELAGGKGIISTVQEEEKKRLITKSHFQPLLTCSKTKFSRQALLNLVGGDIAACFSEQYAQGELNPSLRLPPEEILMIDRITSVDPTGGAWGLGLIVSEKDLEPEHWYFPCHFKDDQVMAGSLVAEGCCQLLQFYLLYLGMQTKTSDARFQPIFNLPQVVRTRKQITACSSKLIYRMEITEVGLSPQPYAKANVDIIFQGIVVVDFKNLGLQLIEKDPLDPYAVSPALQSSETSAALFNEYHIQEFAMGSISACFGPDYKVFEGRRIPRTPNGDLKLMSRITEVNAKRLEFGGNPSLVSQYDVPSNPWFCSRNSDPTMPYSILMEIALQPCGFLSAYLGTTLPHPDEDFFFRNLDGDGHLVKDLDMRGKTITNRVQLLSSTAIQGIIIQKFSFQLVCEEEPFYEGSAAFGYFQPQALANQIGLNKGQDIKPWLEQKAVSGTRIDLNTAAAREQFYRAKPASPFLRLADAQLDFLDKAVVVPKGGIHDLGYIYAEKKVNSKDWFFSCHFYQDPVMPGSLGVEAMIQAMQIYALQQDLGKQLRSPRFTQVIGHKTVWTYRGQIVPANDRMTLEVHIKEINRSPSDVIIIGDASLWKDGLRIYAVTDIAVRLSKT